MNYIIAIDSDGTLRRTDGEISERTKEAITKQIKKNNYESWNFYLYLCGYYGN